jgi:hypothetical protein
MRVSGLKTVLFATVIATGIGAAVFAQGQAQQGQGQAQGQAGQPARQGGQGGQGGGAPAQNLQVLPKDMPRQQLTTLMRSFTAALGVMCDHCHVGTMQERAKDDNPKKAIARKMIQMTAAINNEHMKGVGEPAADGAAKVTCFTCHRGAIKPLSVPGGGGAGHDR